MAQSATGGKPVRDVGALKRWLTRPELAAVAGAILVFAFFALVVRITLTKRGVIHMLM